MAMPAVTGFFDRHATDFADASADAWRQVLTFMEVELS